MAAFFSCLCPPIWRTGLGFRLLSVTYQIMEVRQARDQLRILTPQQLPPGGSNPGTHEQNAPIIILRVCLPMAPLYSQGTPRAATLWGEVCTRRYGRRDPGRQESDLRPVNKLTALPLSYAPFQIFSCLCLRYRLITIVWPSGPIGTPPLRSKADMPLSSRRRLLSNQRYAVLLWLVMKDL